MRSETRARESAIAKEFDDQFYADLLKFVAGEPNGITPDTIGEEQALIAEMLVAEDAGLVAPARRGELMDKINCIYDRDHAVRLTLSDEETALASMLAKKRIFLRDKDR